MTYDQIVSHLADEAKQRIKRGLSQTYKHAILKACDGNYGMMQAVGRLLGKHVWQSGVRSRQRSSLDSNCSSRSNRS